jgi:GNAT superfamily N-acetyltransferase
MSDRLDVEVVEVPHLGGTMHCGFAIRAHAATIEEGLVEGDEVLIYGDMPAIVARLSDETIGIVAFDEAKARGLLFVYLAFVVPDFRRRGVFRLMHDELVKSAERRGCARIESASSLGNVAYNRAAVALGHRVVSQAYRLDV